VNSERIQTGDVEAITLDVRGASGLPLVGATEVQVRIRRKSDGLYLDWDDLTFKGSGWTTLDETATEDDSTLAPGLYSTSLDTGAVTNLAADDTLTVLPIKGAAPDTSTAVLPPPGEIKVGQWVDAVGLDLVTTATIGSAVSDTLRLAAWLVRGGAPVSTGLLSATVSMETAAGVSVVAAGAMAGPSALGVFTRDVPGVTLADATNYITVVTITDGLGAVTRYQAQPTVG
jgi:hypothetical protein